MKKTLIIVGIVLVIIILFLAFRAKKSEAPVGETGSSASLETINIENPSAPTTATANIKPTSLATNLFPQKGSYECKYEQATQTGRSTNTIYISGGKIRGEFRSVDSQGFGTLSMLVYDGSYLYSWTEGKATGTRTQPKSLRDIPVVVPTNIHEGKVLGSGINSVSWDCHAWATVNSMLSKPTYVRFN